MVAAPGQTRRLRIYWIIPIYIFPFCLSDKTHSVPRTCGSYHVAKKPTKTMLATAVQEYGYQRSRDEAYNGGQDADGLKRVLFT